jgi:hypothetical protein
LQKKKEFQRLLEHQQFDAQELLHLSQRYLLTQKYFTIPRQHASCVGAYYMFWSFSGDLPDNLTLPDWICDIDGIGQKEYREYPKYHGDVFLVKMAEVEEGENGWAVYDDIVPEFLECVKGRPEPVGWQVQESQIKHYNWTWKRWL